MPEQWKNICYKYAYNLLDNSIDIDILDIIKEQTTIEKTPILYSIINVWHVGREIVLNEDVLYKYENILSKVYKNLNNTMLLEFFRLILITELDDLSIYIDISERLSIYILFVYFLFYEEEILKPLTSKLELFTNQKYYMIKEMQENMRNIVDKGDMLSWTSN